MASLCLMLTSLRINKEKQLNNKRKIPIGRCPNCGSAVIYSDNGADKLRFTVIRADDDYKGQTYLCAKCKTMVAVIEKPKVTESYGCCVDINR